MAEAKSKKSILIYAAYNGGVNVYKYPSGKFVGSLTTGFDAPVSGCVDAKGDVYFANFYGGTVVEYAHGGTSPLKTYSGVGEPLGCAVDANGDLSVTSFDPGEVTVFRRQDDRRRGLLERCMPVDVDGGIRHQKQSHRAI